MQVKTKQLQNDFSKGPVWKCIITQAVPLTVELFQCDWRIDLFFGYKENGINQF